MNPTLKSTAISIISALIGGATVLGAQAAFSSLRANHQPEPFRREALFDEIFNHQPFFRHQFDQFFNDNFFREIDPFGDFRSVRKHNISVKKIEDSDFVYYEIRAEDLNPTSINTKIENGSLTITGTLEKMTDSSEQSASTRSLFKSSFARTFPLPEYVDPNKMEMSPEKDRIVLKFPKIRT